MYKGSVATSRHQIIPLPSTVVVASCKMTVRYGYPPQGATHPLCHRFINGCMNGEQEGRHSCEDRWQFHHGCIFSLPFFFPLHPPTWIPQWVLPGADPRLIKTLRSSGIHNRSPTCSQVDGITVTSQATRCIDLYLPCPCPLWFQFSFSLNAQPVTSNQQPATSNQQPATSNQQPSSHIVPGSVTCHHKRH